jgi:hypothetical protein
MWMFFQFLNETRMPLVRHSFQKVGLMNEDERVFFRFINITIMESG